MTDHPSPKANFFSSAGDLGADASAPSPISPAPEKIAPPIGTPNATFVPPAAPYVPPTSVGSIPTAAPFIPPTASTGAPTAPFTPPRPVNPTASVPGAPFVPPVSSVPSTPVRKTSSARPKAPDRISVKDELKLLLRQGILVLLGERRNLIISLLFPFIAALITVWIAGEDMFNTYESTKSACFILVCASIWGGLFNSIQSLVKERKNIKRDYVSGALRIECYMGSRAIIQLVLCLIQSFVLAMSIPMVELIHNNDAPSSGLFGLPVIIEVYLSLFLIMYASDALGLMISSIVKKEELASKLAPYILIAQLLFSGVLFKLEGAANVFSGIMISRWGMEALGSICDLNDTPTRIYTDLIDDGAQTGCYCGLLEGLEKPAFEEAFESTGGHLALVFFIMLLFVVVPLVVGDVMLHKVKDDGRE